MTAEFNHPYSVAVDGQGNVYVADRGNNRIRKIDPSGTVSTVGVGESFAAPSGLAIDKQGNVYVADTGNSRIRKIAQSGAVTTLAGNGVGFADGTGGPQGTAMFNAPYGVTVDGSGNVYVADLGNNRIRKIDPGGKVTTLAGNGTEGRADGTGGPNGTAEFSFPTGVAVDGRGFVYVSEDIRIRKVAPDGSVTTVVDARDSFASLGTPQGLAVDAQGNLYIADGNLFMQGGGANLIRRLDTDVNMTTQAGSGAAGYVDGPAVWATFFAPYGVAVDAQGRIYVADTGNNVIRVISP